MLLGLLGDQVLGDEVVDAVLGLEVELHARPQDVILHLSRLLQVVKCIGLLVALSALLLVLVVGVLVHAALPLVGVLRGVPLRELELCVLGFDGLVDVPEALDEDLKGVESQGVLLLGGDDVGVLALLELALCYLGERVHDALEDVPLLEVAIVVDEDLQLVLGVLRDAVEYCQDQVLVVVVGVA